MPFTNLLDEDLVAFAFGKTTYTPATDYWIGLSTTTPTQVSTDNWGITEPSGDAYTHVEVVNNTTNWVEAGSPPTDGYEVVNGTAVTFPQATGSWGEVTYFIVMDAETDGNCVAFGELETPQTISSGDTPAFAIGALTVSNT